MSLRAPFLVRGNPNQGKCYINYLTDFNIASREASINQIWYRVYSIEYRVKKEKEKIEKVYSNH
jgi:hypothetical protein